jgi:DNA-binding MarR family transcriptional regulator
MEENAARLGFDSEGMHNVILKPVRTMSRAGKGGWRFSFTDNRAAGTKKPYTAKQGQYLAFIFYYTKIHRVAPAESDMQSYFKVSPPSVHQMVLTLEANGFIERIPGQGRSIRLLIPREELPDLE